MFPAFPAASDDMAIFFDRCAHVATLSATAFFTAALHVSNLTAFRHEAHLRKNFLFTPEENTDQPMALKSRQHFPPNGWLFYQPETNWHVPNPNHSFNSVVQSIIDHRKANPRFNLPTDPESAGRDLENYTEQRLRAQYGEAAKEWVVLGNDGSTAPPFSPRLREGLPVGAAVDKAKKALAGIGAVIDWLGDGLKPVPAHLAAQRAAVCVSCRHNQEPTGIQRAYELAADGIGALMNSREEMKLSTPHDANLKTCQLCDCVLKLKVFAPIKHIAKRTSADVWKSLPEHCWIKKEIPIDARPKA